MSPVDRTPFWRGVPALLHATDPSGRIVAVSDRWCAALGRAHAAVIGRPEGDFLGPDSRAIADEVRASVLDLGAVEDVPFELQRADGTLVDVLLSAARREVGGALQIVSALTDISEQVRIQGVLDGRDADLRRLTRAASHDLQEPLRDVMGHLKRISDHYGDALDARGRRSLETAVLGGARMRRSVTALRTYSRLLGRRAAQVPVPLATLVERAVHARVGETPVRCEGPGCAAPPTGAAAVAEGTVRVYLGEIPPVLADPAQMALLVDELIDNAFVFAAARPLRLHLDARAVGRRLRIALTDNGIGLDPGLRGRAFGLFTRFEPQRAPDGAGMGLALCRRVMENHGAGIALAAGAFGHGLRVVLDWPLARLTASAG